jgi:hypothetical protein
MANRSLIYKLPEDSIVVEGVPTSYWAVREGVSSTVHSEVTSQHPRELAWDSERPSAAVPPNAMFNSTSFFFFVQ